MVPVALHDVVLVTCFAVQAYRTGPTCEYNAPSHDWPCYTARVKYTVLSIHSLLPQTFVVHSSLLNVDNLSRSQTVQWTLMLRNSRIRLGHRRIAAFIYQLLVNNEVWK